MWTDYLHYWHLVPIVTKFTEISHRMSLISVTQQACVNYVLPKYPTNIINIMKHTMNSKIPSSI